MYECSICDEPLEPTIVDQILSNIFPLPGANGDQPRIVVTRCGHIFHGLCLQEWFKNKVNGPCPICRTNNVTARGVYPTVSTRTELSRSTVRKLTSSSLFENESGDCSACSTLKEETRYLVSVNTTLKSIVARRSNTKPKSRVPGFIAYLESDNKNLIKVNGNLCKEILKLDYKSQSYRDKIQLFNNKNQTIDKENATLRLEIRVKTNENETLRKENQKLRNQNEYLRIENEIKFKLDEIQAPNRDQNAKPSRNFFGSVKNSTRRVLNSSTRRALGCFRAK